MVHVQLAGPTATRARLRAELGSDPGIVVVGEASSDTATIEVARRMRPHVVIVDAANGLHPLATARRLLADPTLAPIEVLLYGAFEREEYVISAWRAGIGGVVSRNVSPIELVRAVRMSAGGAAYVMPAPHRRGPGEPGGA